MWVTHRRIALTSLKLYGIISTICLQKLMPKVWYWWSIESEKFYRQYPMMMQISMNIICFSMHLLVFVLFRWYYELQLYATTSVIGLLLIKLWQCQTFGGNVYIETQIIMSAIDCVIVAFRDREREREPVEVDSLMHDAEFASQTQRTITS